MQHGLKVLLVMAALGIGAAIVAVTLGGISFSRTEDSDATAGAFQVGSAGGSGPPSCPHQGNVSDASAVLGKCSSAKASLTLDASACPTTFGTGALQCARECAITR